MKHIPRARSISDITPGFERISAGDIPGFIIPSEVVTANGVGRTVQELSLANEEFFGAQYQGFRASEAGMANSERHQDLGIAGTTSHVLVGKSGNVRLGYAHEHRLREEELEGQLAHLAITVFLNETLQAGRNPYHQFIRDPYKTRAISAFAYRQGKIDDEPGDYPAEPFSEEANPTDLAAKVDAVVDEKVKSIAVPKRKLWKPVASKRH